MSSIDKLDPGIREEIGRLRDRGHSIDAILKKLRELDVDVSRSALGRHVQDLDMVAERLRRTRSIAEGLIGRLGEQGSSKLAQLNVELMQNAVYQLSVDPDTGDSVVMDAKDANHLASALQKLSAASKTDLELRIAIRRELAAEMAKELDEEARANKGLTADMVASLKARFLGIKAAG